MFEIHHATQMGENFAAAVSQRRIDHHRRHAIGALDTV